jgi:hypothetical protein
MANTDKIVFLNNNPQTSKGHMFPDDQRASKRFAFEAAIIIEKCDSRTYTYGRMYNYSSGGIYFESDVAFQPGTQVQIDVENPTQVMVCTPDLSSAKSNGVRKLLLPWSCMTTVWVLNLTVRSIAQLTMKSSKSYRAERVIKRPEAY